MVRRTQAELDTIQRFAGMGYDDVLKAIPKDERRWKCYTCYTILDNPDLVIKNDKEFCPVCGDGHLQRMCPIDHNHCSHSIIDRVEFCPICGKNICPECGDHSVVAISRVTGYLQDIAGFNAAKRQEVRDRVRVNLQQNGEMAVVHQH